MPIYIHLRVNVRVFGFVLTAFDEMWVVNCKATVKFSQVLHESKAIYLKAWS